MIGVDDGWRITAQVLFSPVSCALRNVCFITKSGNDPTQKYRHHCGPTPCTKVQTQSEATTVAVNDTNEANGCEWIRASYYALFSVAKLGQCPLHASDRMIMQACRHCTQVLSMSTQDYKEMNIVMSIESNLNIQFASSHLMSTIDPNCTPCYAEIWWLGGQASFHSQLRKKTKENLRIIKGNQSQNKIQQTLCFDSTMRIGADRAGSRSIKK